MIQRWRMIFPHDDGYATEDDHGGWVYYADHEAIVKKLVEVMEASEALLNDVRRRYPEIETNGFSCPFFRAIEQAIAKARGQEDV